MRSAGPTSVSHARVRPIWQIGVAMFLAPFVLLLCNLVRLLLWGTVTIYAETHPASVAPRLVSAVASLVLAYALVGGGLAIARYAVREEGAAEA